MKDQIKPGQPRDKEHQDKGVNSNTQNPEKNKRDDETKNERGNKKEDTDQRR